MYLLLSVIIVACNKLCGQDLAGSPAGRWCGGSVNLALVQIAKMERRVELEDGDCTRYIAAPSRERRENLHIVESSGSAPVTSHRGWQQCIVL